MKIRLDFYCAKALVERRNSVEKPTKLGYPSAMAKTHKVFGIGLNKTGTSSLKVALRRLGYDHSPRRNALLRDMFDGDMSSIYADAETYESFEDWPWPLVYKEIFAKYGDSARYILTRRATPDIWLNSIRKHAERVKAKMYRRKIFGYAYPHGVEQVYLDFYTRHLVEVRQFFADNNASHLLCELCWEEGDGWLELCDFLGEPLQKSDFPNSNSSMNAEPDAEQMAFNQEAIALQLKRLKRRD